MELTVAAYAFLAVGVDGSDDRCVAVAVDASTSGGVVGNFRLHEVLIVYVGDELGELIGADD